jgi:hypothetical protein
LATPRDLRLVPPEHRTRILRVREQKRLANLRWMAKPGNREKNRRVSRECHRRFNDRVREIMASLESGEDIHEVLARL